MANELIRHSVHQPVHDGRLDFLLTATTNANAVGAISQLWRNTGNGFENVTATVTPGLPGTGYGAVAWADYDNDGRLDLMITGLTNDGSGALTFTRGAFSRRQVALRPATSPNGTGAVGRRWDPG